MFWPEISVTTVQSSVAENHLIITYKNRELSEVLHLIYRHHNHHFRHHHNHFRYPYYLYHLYYHDHQHHRHHHYQNIRLVSLKLQYQSPMIKFPEGLLVSLIQFCNLKEDEKPTRDLVPPPYIHT
jgi:hypothetical protein